LRTQFKTSLSDEDKTIVCQLWNDEYPKQLHFQSIVDFELYLNNLKEQYHVILYSNQQRIIGWYVEFTREDERWFALIIGAKFHKKGLGTKMLAMAKEKHEILNAWVIAHNSYLKSNGEVYISPLAFYLKNGFRLVEGINLATDKIAAVKIKWLKKDRLNE